MYNRNSELYLQVIRHYFNNKSSLRRTAANFGLHYQTVYKWVSDLRKAISNLESNQVPGSMPASKIEKILVRLKERNPVLTLNQAKKIMEENGYNVSLNCIWHIWKEYGYTGFDWKNISNDFTVFCPWSGETKKKFLQAQALFACGFIKESAGLLNTVPMLPRNDLLLKIPDAYLSPQRLLEKFSMQFGEIPLSEYCLRLEDIYRLFIKKRLYYSALRAGLPLIFALSWKGEFRKMGCIIARLERIINTPRTPKTIFPYKFCLVLLKGRWYFENLKIKSALKTVQSCYKMAMRYKYLPHRLLANLGIFCMTVEKYNLAEELIKLSLRG
uniref:Transposase n=1 Tax=candidate division WOR-3 bacterium TaxID=2052148 RepID=A0A7V0Z6K2_UNCW3